MRWDLQEESSEEIKPLTEEEKKQKLEELRAAMAIKRAAKSKQDAEDTKQVGRGSLCVYLRLERIYIYRTKLLDSKQAGIRALSRKTYVPDQLCRLLLSLSLIPYSLN